MIMDVELTFEDQDFANKFSNNKNINEDDYSLSKLNALPLHTAVSTGDVIKVQELLNSGICNIEARNKQNWTPFVLCLTAKNPNYHIAKLLLSFGANINSAVYNKFSALCLACKLGEDEKIDFLLKNGAIVDCNCLKEMFLRFYVGNKVNEIIKLKFLLKKILLYGYINTKNSDHLFENIIKLDNDISKDNIFQHNKYQTFGKQFTNYCSNIVKEVEYLSNIKINHKYNMVDFLIMPKRMLPIYVNNLTVKEIYLNKISNKQIVCYREIIKNQYQKGLAMKELSEACKESMLHLTSFKLPDLCFDELFIYLSKNDMILINESTKADIKLEV